MGRSYAGILGSLAFIVVVARAVVYGTVASDALMTAWIAMLVFAALGFALGRLAEWVVDDALRGKLLTELSAREVPSGNEAPVKPAQNTS